MRAHAPGAAIGLGGLVLSLGLLAGCAASAPAIAHGAPGTAVSDRVREENACLRASVGQNDEGFTRLPFDIDRHTSAPRRRAARCGRWSRAC
jgi:hypothetical protein